MSPRDKVTLVVVVFCSHSPKDVSPEPQRNISIAAVWGAVRPSNKVTLE